MVRAAGIGSIARRQVRCKYVLIHTCIIKFLILTRLNRAVSRLSSLELSGAD